MQKMTTSAFDTALATIKYWESKEHAFFYSIDNLRDHKSDDKVLSESISKVHHEIVKKILDAYRHLFMFALLLSPKEMLTAKEMVLKRFLDENMEIMNYLHITEQSSWSAHEEKKFREEIENLKKGLSDKV